jgi:hypothetical protein
MDFLKRSTLFMLAFLFYFFQQFILIYTFKINLKNNSVYAADASTEEQEYQADINILDEIQVFYEITGVSFTNANDGVIDFKKITFNGEIQNLSDYNFMLLENKNIESETEEITWNYTDYTKFENLSEGGYHLFVKKIDSENEFDWEGKAEINLRNEILQNKSFDQWWKDEIRIKADADVFPSGSNLEVKYSENNKEYLEYLKKNSKGTQNPEHYVSYEISVLNPEGQPINQFSFVEIWIKIYEYMDLNYLKTAFIADNTDEIFKNARIISYKEKKYFTFTTDRFNLYILCDTLTGNKENSLQTGEENFINMQNIFYCSLMLLSFFAIALIIKKNKIKGFWY